ncbi:MAG: glycosyltransferase [Candidatus Omnitrophica bacterium]|nr:glycosyltransferase [Candidatus Omnitrophota bacterium]
MTEHRLALIIPTKDRPQPLTRLLASVRRQTRGPDQVIIVDSSAARTDDWVRRFGAQGPLRYLWTQPPSLVRQKNLGIAALDPGITLVAFLDDDLVLEDDTLEAMLAFWAAAGSDVGGAGLVIPDARPHRGLWFKRPFGLDGRASGCVLRSGYNTPLRPAAQPYRVQWLSGGASVWRRDVVDAERFDEWFTGYSYLEDIDYSLRVGRRYQMVAVPSARVRHDTPMIAARQPFRLGRWEVTNRFYLATKHPELSRSRCLWALVGQGVLNVARGCVAWRSGGLLRVAGNLVGWTRLVGGVSR